MEFIPDPGVIELLYIELGEVATDVVFPFGDGHGSIRRCHGVVSLKECGVKDDFDDEC